MIVKCVELRDRSLVVDLDGTLIAGDTLWECAFRLLAARPIMALLLPFWLLKGRSHLKARLSEAIAVDPEILCYREDVLTYLREEKSKGRRLVLATAADEKIATEVARHLDLFDDVVASDGRRNLKSKEKLTSIREIIGNNDFDYIGDSRADIIIWQAAGRAIVVGGPLLTGSLDRRGIPIVKRFPVARASFKQWQRALRLHQWVKNTLIFAPVLLAHQVTNIEKMTATAIAFVAFGFCASATYIWNDLLDLPADRRHPTKRNRPLASGQIAVVDGVLASILLMVASLVTSAVFLSVKFVGALLLYVVITVAYSLLLKRKLMVDVIVLGALFALRILIGAIAADVHISEWLLAFAMFFFLSLAFVKRYSDLAIMAPDATEKLGGRGYFAQDLDMVRVMGPLAGYIAVLVVALYVNSPNVLKLYSNPEWLWMVCLSLLYWISRIWFLAHRGQMPEDPVVFALKDRVSQVVAVATLVFVVLASVT